MSTYIAILITVICWGGYPTLAKSAGEGTTSLHPLVMSVAAIVPILLYCAIRGELMAIGPGIGKHALCGILMGIGLISFLIVLSSSQVPISVSIPIINPSMLVVTVVCGIIFLKENPSPINMVGIIGMIPCIAMVSYQTR